MTAQAQPTTLRERHKRHTRDHLLQTAGDLFERRGYAGVTVADIVSAAGVSRATLYTHFSSKDALLEQLVDRMFAVAQGHYEAFAGLPDWSRASLHGWVHTFAESRKADATHYRAMVAAAPRYFLVYSEAHPRFAGLVAALMSNAPLWSRFSAEEATIRASMIVNVLESQLATNVSMPSSVGLEALVGYLGDAVFRLLDEN